MYNLYIDDMDPDQYMYTDYHDLNPYMDICDMDPDPYRFKDVLDPDPYMTIDDMDPDPYICLGSATVALR